MDFYFIQWLMIYDDDDDDNVDFQIASDLACENLVNLASVFL